MDASTLQLIRPIPEGESALRVTALRILRLALVYLVLIAGAVMFVFLVTLLSWPGYLRWMEGVAAGVLAGYIVAMVALPPYQSIVPEVLSHLMPSWWFEMREVDRSLNDASDIAEQLPRLIWHVPAFRWAGAVASLALGAVLTMSFVHDPRPPFLWGALLGGLITIGVAAIRRLLVYRYTRSVLSNLPPGESSARRPVDRS